MVERGYQRRLVYVADPLDRRMGQRQPVVPFADRILQPLHVGYELRRLGGFWSEFGGIARSLHNYAVLMQQVLGDEPSRTYDPCQQRLGSGQRLSTGSGLHPF